MGTVYNKNGGARKPKANIARYVNVIGSGSAQSGSYSYSATPQHGGTIVGTFFNTSGSSTEAGGSTVSCNQNSCSINVTTRYSLYVSWTAYAIEVVPSISY